MDLRFLGAENLPCCDLHIHGRFKHYYVVHLVASGSFYFQRESERRIDIKEPLFFWTDLHSHYSYGPGPSGSWDHHWISFQGELADSYYRPVLEELAPLGYIGVQQVDQLKSCFLGLIDQLNQAGNTRAMVLHSLNRVLSEIHDEKRLLERESDPVERIKSNFDRHPEEHHLLQSLATNSGISYSHFRKSFRERYGESPHHYLIRQRMLRAAQMLAKTELAVSRVGLELNYEDPARFSRVFKDHYGLSPRSYRDSVRGRIS